jgi:predicted transcriptional regulator
MRILTRSSVFKGVSHIMKKKIGTIIDDGLLAGAKQRAALERRPLSVLIEDALNGYLEGGSARDEALRALAKFTSHGGLLPPEEIDEILEEDMLAP